MKAEAKKLKTEARKSRRPTADDVYYVASRLTRRDKKILRYLYRYKVLTTDNIAEMFFDNRNTAQHRLTVLYQLRLVQRFRRLQWRRGVNGEGFLAKSAYHYVLDHLGAWIVAVERDVDVDLDTFRFDPGRSLALADSQRLSHLVGTNSFFSALTAQARTNPGCNLDLWWSENRCAEWCGNCVRPDGFGRWIQGNDEIEFFLEYDRGTEALGRLAEKLEGYAKLERVLGEPRWILFAFESPRRESGARSALSGAMVPVATATETVGQSPHGPIWAPLGANGRRCSLIELLREPIPPESRERVADAEERRRQEAEWAAEREAERERQTAFRNARGW